MNMKIRNFEETDRHAVIQMIAEFRMNLANLVGRDPEINIDQAEQELTDYLGKEYPIYVAEVNSDIIGYAISRVDEEVVWAEQLYVKPNFRRKGIASALYSRIEKLAEDLGGDNVFNWIHPNNHAIVHFLRKHGYNVLNLIEIRKPWKNEVTPERIPVGSHFFDYSQ